MLLRLFSFTCDVTQCNVTRVADSPYITREAAREVPAHAAVRPWMTHAICIAVGIAAIYAATFAFVKSRHGT